MNRVLLFPLVATLVGSAVVLGLFLARGFNLHEHARILLGAATLCACIGAAWTLATAAEDAGGWRRIGVVTALSIAILAAVAAFAPALLVWLVRH